MVVMPANKKKLVFAFFSQNKIFLKYLDKVYFELKKPATHVTGFSVSLAKVKVSFATFLVDFVSRRSLWRPRAERTLPSSNLQGFLKQKTLRVYASDRHEVKSPSEINRKGFSTSVAEK